MTNWKPITDEIRRPVVVTNNINARNAHGHMSHLWVTSLVQRSDKPAVHGEFICFDGYRRVECLTHYAEIDPPQEPGNG